MLTWSGTASCAGLIRGIAWKNRSSLQKSYHCCHISGKKIVVTFTSTRLCLRRLIIMSAEKKGLAEVFGRRWVQKSMSAEKKGLAEVFGRRWVQKSTGPAVVGSLWGTCVAVLIQKQFSFQKSWFRDERICLNPMNPIRDENRVQRYCLQATTTRLSFNRRRKDRKKCCCAFFFYLVQLLLTCILHYLRSVLAG